MTPVQRAAHLSVSLRITNPAELARLARVTIGEAQAALKAANAPAAPLVASERRPQ